MTVSDVERSSSRGVRKLVQPGESREFRVRSSWRSNLVVMRARACDFRKIVRRSKPKSIIHNI
eukprot:9251156-Pyramimonas_sp.AAC.1